MKRTAATLSIFALAMVANGQGTENVSACEKRTVSYGWFGAPTDIKSCSDCTTVTYISGAGKTDPAYCAKYKDYVADVQAQAGKVVIPLTAGFVPGAFDRVSAGVWWIEIGSREKYGPSTFTTLPNGMFDKMPARATVTDIELSSSKVVGFATPEKVFGAPLPKAKKMQLNFSPSEPLVGLGPKLFNKNLATLQMLQLYFGNPQIPEDTLVNLVQLRNLNLLSNKLTALPPALLKSQKKLKELYLGGQGLDAESRYNPMPISALPSQFLSYAPNLNWLQVRGTNVKALPADMFAKNPKLSNVLFMDSALTTLPVGLFASNPVANNMQVYGNDITSIPAGALPTDRPFELSFTPQRSGGATCASLKLPANIQCM